MDPLNINSISDIQKLLLSPPTEAVLGSASREEKQQWMREVLSRIENYEILGKEEKGIVRNYLQLITGYSRAQLTRNLRLALDELTVQATQTQVKSQTLWRTFAVWILGPSCALLILASLIFGDTGSKQASLVFMNPGADEFNTLHGVVTESVNTATGTLENIEFTAEVSKPIQIRTITTSNIGPAISHPLFVATVDSFGREESAPSDERLLFALDVQELIRRVEQRRQERLERNILQRLFSRFRSDDADHASAPSWQDDTEESFKNVYPLHGSAQEYNNPKLLELFGMGREGQILMLKNGVPQWQNIPLADQLREAAPHGDEGSYRSGGGARRGGGGGDGSTATTTTTTNVTNNYTTITQGGSGTGATFRGTTTVTTYNGQLTSGAYVGYQAANAICAAEYEGSHFCRTDEVIGTISAKDISSLFSGVPDAWMAEGPPGYTADSNDCKGWTSSGATHLGAWWEFSTAGGGIGYLTNCSTAKPLACCK